MALRAASPGADEPLTETARRLNYNASLFSTADVQTSAPDNDIASGQYHNVSSNHLLGVSDQPNILSESQVTAAGFQLASSEHLSSSLDQGTDGFNRKQHRHSASSIYGTHEMVGSPRDAHASRQSLQGTSLQQSLSMPHLERQSLDRTAETGEEGVSIQRPRACTLSSFRSALPEVNTPDDLHDLDPRDRSSTGSCDSSGSPATSAQATFDHVRCLDPVQARREEEEEETGADKAKPAVSSSAGRTKGEKPGISYIELIARAILSTPDRRLMLHNIYRHIMTQHPYYNNDNKAWRNSVRHNLSLNECFGKHNRTENGKGHFWRIHPNCIDDFIKGDFRRRRARQKARSSPIAPAASINSMLGQGFTNSNNIMNGSSYCHSNTTYYSEGWGSSQDRGIKLGSAFAPDSTLPGRPTVNMKHPLQSSCSNSVDYPCDGSMTTAEAKMQPAMPFESEASPTMGSVGSFPFHPDSTFKMKLNDVHSLPVFSSPYTTVPPTTTPYGFLSSSSFPAAYTRELPFQAPTAKGGLPRSVPAGLQASNPFYAPHNANPAFMAFPGIPPTHTSLFTEVTGYRAHGSAYPRPSGPSSAIIPGSYASLSHTSPFQNTSEIYPTLPLNTFDARSSAINYSAETYQAVRSSTSGTRELAFQCHSDTLPVLDSDPFGVEDPDSDTTGAPGFGFYGARDASTPFAQDLSARSFAFQGPYDFSRCTPVSPVIHSPPVVYAHHSATNGFSDASATPPGSCSSSPDGRRNSYPIAGYPTWGSLPFNQAASSENMYGK